MYLPLVNIPDERPNKINTHRARKGLLQPGQKKEVRIVLYISRLTVLIMYLFHRHQALSLVLPEISLQTRKDRKKQSHHLHLMLASITYYGVTEHSCTYVFCANTAA